MNKGKTYWMIMGCLFWQVFTPQTLHADYCGSYRVDRCSEPCGFLIGAEYLLWQTYQTNMDFAHDEELPNPDDPPLPYPPLLAGEGRIHFIDYDWRSGIRIYGIYRAGCDSWDGRVVWTHYHNRGSEHVDLYIEELDEFLNPVDPQKANKASLTHPDSTVIDDDGFGKGHAHNDLEYDVIDALITRTFCCIDQSLIMKPFFGLRLMYLNQDLNAMYRVYEEAEIDEEEVNVETGQSKVLFDSDYKGIGLHSGIDMEHHLIGNLELFGSISGSVVAGTVRNGHVQKDDGVKTVDLHEKQQIMIPGFQLGVGFMWHTPFICGSYFETKIGYEFTSWYHTPQARRFVKQNSGVTTPSTSGQIGFHGGNFRLFVSY